MLLSQILCQTFLLYNFHILRVTQFRIMYRWGTQICFLHWALTDNVPVQAVKTNEMRRYRSSNSWPRHCAEVWSASRHGRFTPREMASSTHWMGDWLGPKADLGALKKWKIIFPAHLPKACIKKKIYRQCFLRGRNWSSQQQTVELCTNRY